MVHKRFRIEFYGITGFNDPYTQFNIFATRHAAVAMHGIKHTFANAHIKPPRIVLMHVLFAPANAARGKKRSHRIAYGLLDIGERFMRFVRAAKGIGICFL